MTEALTRETYIKHLSYARPLVNPIIFRDRSNTLKSPLIRLLLPELRVIIYKRVLGGKIIHAYNATELDYSNYKRPYYRLRFDVYEIPIDFSIDIFEIETYIENKELRE